jgi:hypothetical protein
MAHFAKLDDANTVTQVIVVDNRELLDVNNQEQESIGVGFLTRIFGHANWKQTSYNGTFRKNYAGIGSTYDSGRDAFIAPNPGDGYTLDETTCRWVKEE